MSDKSTYKIFGGSKSSEKISLDCTSICTSIQLVLIISETEERNTVQFIVKISSLLLILLSLGSKHFQSKHQIRSHTSTCFESCRTPTTTFKRFRFKSLSANKRLCSPCMSFRSSKLTSVNHFKPFMRLLQS